MERHLALEAQAVRNRALRLAPVDTGRLRQSVSVQQTVPLVFRVGTNVEYAPHVEFGTRKMRARPFLRPALRGK